MSADDGDRTARRAPDDEPTPFEKPGGPPEKPRGRGRFPIGALVAVLLGVLIVLAVVLAVVATGGHGNGQTTSLGPLVLPLLS